jgi:hypothetical protein
VPHAKDDNGIIVDSVAEDVGPAAKGSNHLPQGRKFVIFARAPQLGVAAEHLGRPSNAMDRPPSNRPVLSAEELAHAG